MSAKPGSSSDDPRARAERFAARLPDVNGNPGPIGSHVDTTDDAEAARRAWDRRRPFSVQTPARAPHPGHRDYEPGTAPAEIARDQARQRRRLREHAAHPAAPKSARAFARQELARMNAARRARGMRRRTPPPRPAARRAHAGRRRRTASSSRTAGADPPAAEGDDDPPGRAARLRRWLDSRRDPWRVREAPLGLWRIRAEYVRLAARARRLP